MATSLKNECKRWAWQLLMAVCSPIYVLCIGGFFDALLKPMIKNEFSEKILVICVLVFIVIYYLISIYINFISDKNNCFKSNFYASIRTWIFLITSSLFTYSVFLFNANRSNELLMFNGVTPFVLFPIISIFFTWWISELIVRRLQKTRPDLLKSTPNQLKASNPSDLSELPNTLENAVKKVLVRNEK